MHQQGAELSSLSEHFEKSAFISLRNGVERKLEEISPCFSIAFEAMIVESKSKSDAKDESIDCDKSVLSIEVYSLDVQLGDVDSLDVFEKDKSEQEVIGGKIEDTPKGFEEIKRK